MRLFYHGLTLIHSTATFPSPRNNPGIQGGPLAKKIMWSVLFVLVAPFLVWLVLSAPAYFISWFTPAFVDSSMYWLIGWVSWRPLYLLAALIYLFVPYDPHPRSSTLGY